MPRKLSKGWYVVVNRKVAKTTTPIFGLGPFKEEATAKERAKEYPNPTITQRPPDTLAIVVPLESQ